MACFLYFYTFGKTKSAALYKFIFDPLPPEQNIDGHHQDPWLFSSSPAVNIIPSAGETTRTGQQYALNISGSHNCSLDIIEYLSPVL